MAKTGIKWKPQRFKKTLVRTSARRMERAAQEVEDQAVRLVSRAQAHRIQKSGKGKGLRIGLDPSVAPDPPKVVEGVLRSSHKHQVEVRGKEVVGIVGAGTLYARRLHEGFQGPDKLGRTINQAARPWLTLALKMRRRRVAKILGVR